MKKSRLAVIGLTLTALVLVGIALATDRQRPHPRIDPVAPAPTGSREQQIYTDVATAIGSKANPANRAIPKNLLKEDRDENAFEEWTMETMSLGIEYQQKIFKEVGKKYGLSPESVAEIHARVYDWRQMNDLPLK